MIKNYESFTDDLFGDLELDENKILLRKYELKIQKVMDEMQKFLKDFFSKENLHIEFHNDMYFSFELYGLMGGFLDGMFLRKNANQYELIIRIENINGELSGDDNIKEKIKVINTFIENEDFLKTKLIEKYRSIVLFQDKIKKIHINESYFL